jgi:hypothetical protein
MLLYLVRFRNVGISRFKFNINYGRNTAETD